MLARDEMFAAYRRGGADAELVMLGPFGKEGHDLFHSSRGLPIWKSVVDRFLVKTRLSARS